jgi:hypothetical protein
MRNRVLIRLSVLLAIAVTATLANAAAVGNTPISIVLPSPISGATDGASIEVDANGRVHAAFEISLGGQVIYATCASNCSSEANWTSVHVGNNGSLGTRPILKLTPSGQPRMMYVREETGSSNPEMLVYNACDSACTSAANWKELDVEAVNPPGAGVEARLFALDNQGRPRAIISSPSEVLFYFTCDSGCSDNAANWFYTGLNAAKGSQAAITIDSAGNPHVLYKTTDNTVSADNDILAYATCMQTCSNEANWSIGYIFLIGRGFQAKYSIDTTSANQPRIAFYSASLVTNVQAEANVLNYAWCASGCQDGANWAGAYVGTSAQDGIAPDLVLDSNNRPHISYYNDASGYQVGYAMCSASCESASAVWKGGHLESPVEYPSAPAPGCTNPFWYATSPTALALDAGGNPHIVFGARNLQNCGATIRETLRLVRYIDVAQARGPGPTPGPGTPTATVDPSTLDKKVYLPLALR